MILNEITGYIEMPFHGEKGESAYDIAVKYGYEGTEEEWLDSLGFIPDKSIGEEKLSDTMVGKFREYEDIISSMFEKKSGYEKSFVNEYDGAEGAQANVTTQMWIAALENYEVPYIVKGVYAKNQVLLPKINSVTLFDETNASLWSSPSSDYYLTKINVSDYTGKYIKIYGRSQATPYPLAFCVDKSGNILERYGTDTYKLYGYSFPDDYTATGYSEEEAVEAMVPEGAEYIYIQGGILKKSGVVKIDAVAKLEILVDTYKANEEYKIMQSPLYGKKLYVDGDSICYGNGYKGGFGKIIADKYNMRLVNNGVGGATVCQNTCTDVSYTSLDWGNNDYYLGLTYTIPSTENNYQDGFRVPLTEYIYNNGFGVYPTYYKIVNGEIVEQEYRETMPTGKWYIKFDIPTYGGNAVEKYVAMWAYPDSDGSYSTPETTGNRWLWEAYKSGFATAHQSGYAKIGVPRHWLSKSVENIPSDADYVIFEGGLNDYLLNRRLGEITEDYTGVVDTTTVIGGMEYICRQLLEKGKGKKLMYVITHKSKNHSYTKNILGGSKSYKTWTEYHDAILSVLRKYSIPCVDLFNNSALNTELKSYLGYTNNNDAVHPNKEGYELFYVPQIVNVAESI